MILAFFSTAPDGSKAFVKLNISVEQMIGVCFFKKFCCLGSCKIEIAKQPVKEPADVSDGIVCLPSALGAWLEEAYRMRKELFVGSDKSEDASHGVRNGSDGE